MYTPRFPVKVAISIGALIALLSASVSATISQEPLTVTRAIRPIVMLALSNDHQLYKKAYDDHTDIDDDGVLEVGYDNSYDYYGYFDPDLCYAYSAGNGYFAPSGAATTHQCSGAWSGNFLNWATMTRMDLLRRVLYGGHRVVDEQDDTVLERALIPQDFHAFAKVFAPAGGSSEVALYTPYSGYAEITLCNVTNALSGESQSLDTSANPPLVKVAQGDWTLWATGEASTPRIPCAWEPAGSSQNVAPSLTSEIGTLSVRVQVCASGYDEQSCKRYPGSTAKKPIGILQEYGDSKSLRFGLVSGSYTKNVSGGVLRRNSGYVADNDVLDASDDEIDVDTGRFTGNAGIISTIDAFRINKFDYGVNYYTDSCVAPGISGFSDGECTNWGNPIAEIVLETLRYLNGRASATSDFDADDSGVSSALADVTWSDPMSANEWCADCSVLVVTGGVNSFDRDYLINQVNDMGVNATVQTDLVGTAEGISGSYVLGGNATQNDGNCYGRHIDSLSEAVGVCPAGGKLEGGWLVAGLSYFAHVNDFRNDRVETQDVRTRAIDMGDGMPHFQIRAHDPSHPQFSGFFSLTPVCVTNPDPTAELPRARDLLEEIGFGAVVPADTGEGWRQCGLWDVLPMNLLYDAEGYVVGGDLYAFWEDTPYGNDADLDAVSRVHFCVGDALDGDGIGVCTDDPLDEGWGVDKDPGSYTLPTVTKDYELRITTSVVQAYTDKALSFGFVISGAHNPNQPNDFHCDNGYHGDGMYLEEVVHGVATDADDDVPTKKDKKNKKDDDDADTGPFSVANADLDISADNPERQPGACGRKFRPDEQDPLLKPPLWYATKYGNFNDQNDNDIPDLTEEWDTDLNGDPDGYYMLYEPQNVGESFESIFSLIAGVSSSSSVVANSLVLQTGTYIYQGRFDSTDWSGDLIAFPVNMDGTLAEPDWSAKEVLNDQADGGGWDTARVILTSNGASGAGIAFRWSDDLTADQKDALNANPKTGVDDGLGAARLDFIRGDASNELQQGGYFRDRTWLLGDVVDSDPVYAGQPPFNYSDSFEYAASYSQFAAVQRDEMLYVGANDGMLHGFDASNGRERVAYVPRALYDTLPALTMLDYRDNHRFYVDGSLVLGDVIYSFNRVSGVNPWRTLLVGTLGAGGQGVFALDVTDPDDFSEATADVEKVVRWDFTSGDTGFEDLGYTFSAPALVKVPYWYAGGRYGTWIAAFGNGYGSADGTATLYAIGAGSGTRISTVEAHPGPGNGLSSIAPVDVDLDKEVDYIYAGDLLGNIWRFDRGSYGTWYLGLGGQPLFTATDPLNNTPQPITVKPDVFRHERGGVVVVVGTGKYFEVGDAAPDTTVVNSLYGVWDRLDGTANLTRAHLLKQEFIAGGSHEGYDIRVSSDHQIAWHSGTGTPTDFPPSTHMGWYLDLVMPNAMTGSSSPEGEMVVAEIKSRGSRVIFTSMVPSQEPCEYGGEGWLIEVESLDGSRPDNVLFDLNWDGTFSMLDVPSLTVNNQEEQLPPNAKRSTIGIVQQPAIISAGMAEYKFSSGGMPASVEVTRENPGESAGGRQSWAETDR